MQDFSARGVYVGIILWLYNGVRVVARLVRARTSLKRVVGVKGHPNDPWPIVGCSCFPYG